MISVTVYQMYTRTVAIACAIICWEEEKKSPLTYSAGSKCANVKMIEAEAQLFSLPLSPGWV